MNYHRIILALLFLATSTFSYAQNWSPSAIEAAGKDYTKAKNHPGLVISVYFQGESRVFTFGEMEIGKGESPDENSVFELGQVSEVFTSTLMAKMTYEGLLSPERGLFEYLPEAFPLPVFQNTVCIPDQKNSESPDGSDPFPKSYSPTHQVFCYPVYGSPPGQITFCQTASHTSGLPKYLRSRKHSCSDLTRVDMEDFLRGFDLNDAPGLVYKASEIGPALMGFTLGRIAGQSFEKTLVEKVCLPLGMHQTRISAGPGLQTNLASGHSKSGKVKPNCKPGILAPALGIRSTGLDMLTFLQANIEEENEAWSRVFMECHQARIDLDEAKTEGGYGWKISYLPMIKDQVIWKSGQTTGFASYLGLNKERKYGINILSNSADEVRELGQKLMEILDKFVVDENKDKPGESPNPNDNRG